MTIAPPPPYRPPYGPVSPAPVYCGGPPARPPMGGFPPPQPAYGPGAPVYAYPPVVNGARRRRVWVVAAAVFGALFLPLFVWVVRQPPPAANQFVNGGSVTVALRAGESRSIYVAPGQDPDAASCRVSAGGARSFAGITHIRASRRNRSGIDRAGGWKATQRVTASQDGSYTVTCTGSPGATFRVEGPMTVLQFIVYAVFGVGVFSLKVWGLVIRNRRRAARVRARSGGYSGGRIAA